MNLDDLTIKQVKELSAMLASNNPKTLNDMIGKKVIIRTYSAGVWFGLLAQKSGNEVILQEAKRLWRWWAVESISLSAVSIYGIKPEKSKIAPAVNSVWLEAIEIIPCSNTAIRSIEDCEDAKAI